MMNQPQLCLGTSSVLLRPHCSTPILCSQLGWGGFARLRCVVQQPNCGSSRSNHGQGRLGDMDVEQFLTKFNNSPILS